MCFHLAATSAAKTLEARFNAMFPESDLFEPAEEFNAFAHPKLPVITEGKPEQIELFNWGLVPGWVKDKTTADKLKKATLNARIETAFDKPSFREPMRFQRCIIPATAFYEWKHIEAEVKVKAEAKAEVKAKERSGNESLIDLFPAPQPPLKELRPAGSAQLSAPSAQSSVLKYKISTDREVFAFAGIWDSWQEWKGFSILTMPANPLMARIHNTAKRMPFILTPDNETKWLDPERVKLYDIQELIVSYPEEKMRAEPVTRDE
jgi:putative SOS response-associated peptidase YedK